MSTLKKHKGLAIAHINIRSLWPKIDTLKILLQHEIDVDILGLSESWLTSTLDNNIVNIPGYDIIRNDRNWCDNDNENGKNVKKGGGVCLYINHNMNYSTHALSNYNVSCKNIECQWIKIIQEKQRNIVVGNVYRPPQGNVKNAVEYLEGVFELLDLEHEDLILMGDFNIDFLEKRNLN